MSDNFIEVGTDPGDLDDSQDPCLAAGIGGYIVSEKIDITEVCQDPDDLSIVYLRVSVVGVFTYTPNLTVSYVDSNGSDKIISADSKLILNYKNSAESPSAIPFSTECGSTTVLLAYNVGTLIPEFSSVTELTFNLKLIGEFTSENFDQDFIANLGLFESINPSDSVVFTKGLNPQPYALFFDENTGQLRLQFSNIGNLPCSCNISCLDISLNNEELVPCDDELQEVTVETDSLFDSPTDISLSIEDSIGNVTNLEYHIVINTVPKAPSVIFRNYPDRIEVSPFFITEDDQSYIRNKIEYQIWRYENNTSNTKLVRDWSSDKFRNFIDTDIQANTNYGYSIRIKGSFGSLSQFSAWAGTSINPTLIEGRNLVIWMTDDIGRSQMPFYSDLSQWPDNMPFPSMPFMQSLVDYEALRFTNAGVNTRCSPTRAAMLCGKMGHISIDGHLKGTDHLHGHGIGDVPGNTPDDQVPFFSGLKASHKPWPVIAKAAGAEHKFLKAGKYHLFEYTSDSQDGIQNRRAPVEIAGFDTMYEAVQAGGGAPYYGYYNNTYYISESDSANDSTGTSDIFSPTAIYNFTTGWIDEQFSLGNNIVLDLWPNLAHGLPPAISGNIGPNGELIHTTYTFEDLIPDTLSVDGKVPGGGWGSDGVMTGGEYGPDGAVHVFWRRTLTLFECLDWFTSGLYHHISGNWPEQFQKTTFMHYSDNGADSSSIELIETNEFAGLGGYYTNVFPPTQGINSGTTSGTPFHYAEDAKGETKDEGILTHLLVWGELLPDSLKATDCHAMIDAQDFYPTILDILAKDDWKAALGSEELAKLDGESFYYRILSGDRGDKTESYHEGFQPGWVEDENDDVFEFDRCIRYWDGTGVWKLRRIYTEATGADGKPTSGMSPYLQGKQFLLYNISDDPTELTDLIPYYNMGDQNVINTVDHLLPLYWARYGSN